DRLGGEPTVPAMQANALERDGTRLPGKGALVQVGECGAMVRSNHVAQEHAAYLLDIRRLDHFEARRIHIEQASLVIDELDAFGLAFDDRAQAVFTRLQRVLGAAAIRDVERHAGDAANLTGAVP